MSMSGGKSTGDLRVHVARLRQELTEATEAYKSAVARHDSEKTIPLLRSRSQLMRQLLESQCQLLLSLRCSVPEAEQTVFPIRPEPEPLGADRGVTGDSKTLTSTFYSVAS